MAEVSLLRQAWVLYKQGRFTTALESLEPKIFQHREAADQLQTLRREVSQMKHTIFVEDDRAVAYQ